MSKCRQNKSCICGEGGIHYALRALLAARAPSTSVECSTSLNIPLRFEPSSWEHEKRPRVASVNCHYARLHPTDSNRSIRSTSRNESSSPFGFRGEGGIRTLGTVTRTHDFQSCTFGLSVTSPALVLCVASPHEGLPPPVRPRWSRCARNRLFTPWPPAGGRPPPTPCSVASGALRVAGRR